MSGDLTKLLAGEKEKVVEEKADPKPWGKCSRGCFGNHERLSHTSDGLFKSILSAIVDELWHTYLPPGRRRTSQDVPANARRRRGHGFARIYA